MKLWQSQKQAYEESLKYLKGRKEGTIKSILTPWQKVNDATINGIEWNSMTVIGARPGGGKTLMKDQIVANSFRLNEEKFRVLEFSLEMLGKNSAIRDYSAHLGKSYKYLCSADGELSDADFNECIKHARNMIKYPIDIVEKSPTITQFNDIIEEYMLANSSMTSENKRIHQKTLITLDHSLLLTKRKGQNVNDMLFDFGEVCTSLKRKYPISFIILSQLNRNIDNPDRNEDGKYGNYVLESDIFGADALLQHADFVVGLTRPAKRKIRFYGPDRFIIDNDRQLVMHFLKARNGDVGLGFFEAAFEKMQILEAPTPAMVQLRSKN